MIVHSIDMNTLLNLLESYESEFNLPTLRYAPLEDRLQAIIDAAREDDEADNLREEVSGLQLEVKSLQSDIDNYDCDDCDEEIDAMQTEIIKLEDQLETYRAQFGEIEDE